MDKQIEMMKDTLHKLFNEQCGDGRCESEYENRQSCCQVCLAKRLCEDGWRKPQWISVEERLPDPKEYDWVLVNVMDDNDGTFLGPQIAECRKGEWYCLGDHFSLAELECTVTHWMPLPEPPKGGIK